MTALLLEANGLECDEAVLTGESLPAEKQSEPIVFHHVHFYPEKNDIPRAIAIVPRVKWAFLVIALLPSALYSRAVVSADGGLAAGLVVVEIER